MRSSIPLFAILCLIVTAAESADPPAAREVVRDFAARGIVQIDLPPSDSGDGTKVIDAGVNLMLPINQAFVWPDRTLLEVEIGNSLNMYLSQSSTEYQFNPASGYLLETTYRNLNRAEYNPMFSRQLSIVAWADLIPKMKSLRELPDRDPKELKTKNEARIAALLAERDRLKADGSPRHIPRINEVASEAARLRDQVNQLEMMKEHPCRYVEVDNADFINNFASNRLVGPSAARLLKGGKTEFVLTRKHGLPIRMESRTSDGKPIIYVCLNQIRVNQGLKPGDVSVGAPPGTELLRISVDMAGRNWQEQLELETARRVQQLEDRRRALEARQKGVTLSPRQ